MKQKRSSPGYMSELSHLRKAMKALIPKANVLYIDESYDKALQHFTEAIALNVHIAASYHEETY